MNKEVNTVKKKFTIKKESLKKLVDNDLTMAAGGGSDVSNACCPPTPLVV